MAYPNRSNVTFPAGAGIVSLAEVKQHLSLFDDDTFDTYLAEIIIAATTHAGTFISQALELSEITDYYKAWDSRLVSSEEHLDTVVSVQYYDENNVVQTIAATDYILDTTSSEAAVVFVTPRTERISTDIANPVLVNFESIHIAAADNRAIKQAILIIVADLFNERETNIEGSRSKAHLTAERLLAPYRRQRI